MKFLRISNYQGLNQDVRILINKGPVRRNDRSFIYKILVKRTNLRKAFSNSKVVVFLVLQDNVKDQSSKYAGWTVFLRTMDYVGFGVFSLEGGVPIYYELPPVATVSYNSKIENEYEGDDALTNSTGNCALSILRKN